MSQYFVSKLSAFMAFGAIACNYLQLGFMVYLFGIIAVTGLLAFIQ